MHKLGICVWTWIQAQQQRKALEGLGGCSLACVLHGYPNPYGCLHCWLTSPCQLSLSSASAGVSSLYLIVVLGVLLPTACSASTRSGNIPRSLHGISQGLCCHRRPWHSPTGTETVKTQGAISNLPQGCQDLILIHMKNLSQFDQGYGCSGWFSSTHLPAAKQTNNQSKHISASKPIKTSKKKATVTVHNNITSPTHPSTKAFFSLLI